MNGNRYYGVRVEGAKYGVGFGSALAIAISYQQPLDSLGDHPRHSGLALRDLCRAVWVIQPTASVARMERSEIRGHIRRIAIPDLWRQTCSAARLLDQQ